MKKKLIRKKKLMMMIRNSYDYAENTQLTLNSYKKHVRKL